MDRHDPAHRAPLRVDAQGRPCFLWGLDMNLDAFREGLGGDDVDVRAYLIGKLLRQARPDDVARFVSDDEVRAIWPLAVRQVGRARGYWRAPSTRRRRAHVAMSGRLSALQVRILRTLAGALTGRWVRTGGAALGGFYTAH